MSISAKHAYRFGFLRSEKWQSFRLEVLALYEGKCVTCERYSLSTDVHHIWYPKGKLLVEDVRPLCRECHDSAHLLTNPKTYKSRKTAKKMFQKFFFERRKQLFGELSPRGKEFEKQVSEVRLILNGEIDKVPEHRRSLMEKLIESARAERSSWSKKVVDAASISQ